MIELYNDVSYKISKTITSTYSTSFSIAVSCLDSATKNAIYSIYGFVRLADEIVDTFHDFNKKELLSEFENEYYKAYSEGLSLNPVLHSFQITVKKYDIPDELIQAFLQSMKTDLVKKDYYKKSELDIYIYGSAEAVGLMCLKVFVNGDKNLYDELRYPAMKLGAAFQKVNFLRDLKNDIHNLNRNYFPDVEFNLISQEVKNNIVRDIKTDFIASLPGIRSLPRNVKFPVLIAYYYYLRLLNKISNTPVEKLHTRRIRVHDSKKMLLLAKAYLVFRLRLI